MRQKTLEEQLQAILKSLAQLDAESANGSRFIHLRAQLRKRAEELELKIRSGADPIPADQSFASGTDSFSTSATLSAMA